MSNATCNAPSSSGPRTSDTFTYHPLIECKACLSISALKYAQSYIDSTTQDQETCPPTYILICQAPGIPEQVRIIHGQDLFSELSSHMCSRSNEQTRLSLTKFETRFKQSVILSTKTEEMTITFWAVPSFITRKRDSINMEDSWTCILKETIPLPWNSKGGYENLCFPIASESTLALQLTFEEHNIQAISEVEKMTLWTGKDGAHKRKYDLSTSIGTDTIASIFKNIRSQNALKITRYTSEVEDMDASPISAFLRFRLDAHFRRQNELLIKLEKLMLASKYEDDQNLPKLHQISFSKVVEMYRAPHGGGFEWIPAIFSYRTQFRFPPHLQGHSLNHSTDEKEKSTWSILNDIPTHEIDKTFIIKALNTMDAFLVGKIVYLDSIHASLFDLAKCQGTVEYMQALFHNFQVQYRAEMMDIVRQLIQFFGPDELGFTTILPSALMLHCKKSLEGCKSILKSHQALPNTIEKVSETLKELQVILKHITSPLNTHTRIGQSFEMNHIEHYYAWMQITRLWSGSLLHIIQNYAHILEDQMEDLIKHWSITGLPLFVTTRHAPTHRDLSDIEYFIESLMSISSKVKLVFKRGSGDPITITNVSLTADVIQVVITLPLSASDRQGASTSLYILPEGEFVRLVPLIFVPQLQIRPLVHLAYQGNITSQGVKIYDGEQLNLHSYECLKEMVKTVIQIRPSNFLPQDVREINALVERVEGLISRDPMQQAYWSSSSHSHMDQDADNIPLLVERLLRRIQTVRGFCFLNTIFLELPSTVLT